MPEQETGPNKAYDWEAATRRAEVERDEAREQAERLNRERHDLAAALSLISQHAHADEAERGFGEASRYYAIADEALAPAATGEERS